MKRCRRVLSIDTVKGILKNYQIPLSLSYLSHLKQAS